MDYYDNITSHGQSAKIVSKKDVALAFKKLNNRLKKSFNHQTP